MKKYILSIFIILFTVGATWAQELSVSALKAELEKAKTANDESSVAHYLGQLAHSYWQENNFNEAATHFKELQVLSERMGNQGAIDKIHNVLGQIYYDKEDYNASLACYTTSLVAKRKGGDKLQIVSEILNVASVYIAMEQGAKAIESYKEALSLATELNHLKLMRSANGGLADCYNNVGESEVAMGYYETFRQLDAHIKKGEFSEIISQNKNKISQIDAARRETERELSETTDVLSETLDELNVVTLLNEKKQMAIELLEIEKENERIELERKEEQLASEKRRRIFLTIIVVSVLLFAIVLVRLYSDKRKANGLLKQQNTELEEKNDKIDSQRHELLAKNGTLEKQKTEIEKQREQLEIKNIAITESIDSAKVIQDAMLPAEMAIRKHFSDSFVYFRPKHIVSGDFYWYAEHKNDVWVAAVDCTGHSVPGAFMSMMGHSLLNEIVNEKKIESVAGVIESMHDGVVGALQRTTNTSDVSDGMEISIVKHERDKKRVVIVNTNQTVVIVQNDKPQIIEGDYLGVGGESYEGVERVFVEKIIEAIPGTQIYLFSDGFQDQHGGPRGKKFQITRLTKAITSNADKRMVEQHESITKVFDEWRGDYPQTDDVMLLGLKI